MLENEDQINKEISEHLTALQNLFKKHGLIFKSITLGGLLNRIGIEATYGVEEMKDSFLKD